ncbi:uncharacterized protein LOC119794439 [Cyprinodon tularosa]|uniref:uncharacterized protein LOC119794439 n=1 Tax=Cyprinodon tularosa TaxID=77115 RepID=UPI0018E217DB|nr:uncharacterized protein LOC119794439 [Cyprinodon tularosa]
MENKESSFFCELVNPVSSSSSETVENPFITADLIYGKVGGSIILNPGQISEPIEKVKWRHKLDLTSKSSWQDIKSDGAFKGHCDFDKTSGSLTINSLTLEDSGSYIVEINNKVLEKKELQVIKPVPKPTVSTECNHEKTSCNLTCEAQVTADFGPVTYKWKTGDTELSTDKELLITTENKESSFFCELVNPVSSSSSETMYNPFIRADLIYGKVGGSIVLIPGQISEPIEKVKWRYKMDLTSKGSWQDIQSDEAFKGRCDFDKTSGSLTINSLTLEDSGSYIVEINNKVLEMKKLQVIKPVPKPTVSIKYNHEKDAWSLTCEAQVTADFGPVTYKWKTGDTELSTDKELLITTENKESSFFCELVNPVSSSSSETVENPFITADLIYGKVGGSIVLKPGQIPETIKKVTWRHKVDLTSKGSWQDIQSEKAFKGRCDFDKTSGSLTINRLTLKDSGSYRPEINNKVLEMKELQVIKPVPKPTVSIKYNHEKDAWSLTCEAQVTADFGPVTYKWKTGDTELSTDKELLITTENKESSFFCELVNPVSSSSSEIMDNPFIRADLIYGKVGGSIVLKPGQIPETIKKVTWRHKVDLTSKGSWQDIQSEKAFKGRCDFDKTSGSLTINSLTLKDSGSYIAEINNKVLEMKELQVIKPVPKPTVSIKYNHEKDAWSLTCEAQVTADFGPVTYKWKTGDTELSTDKELLITTENKESSFFCELVNPVSSSSSEIMDNPFIRGRCDFDKTSGSLTINSLTLEDSGSYIAEINNKVLEKKKLQVIKPVPKPTVSIKCNKEKTSYSLTCEAQVTADFGPVTYKWKTGDTELSTDKELLITTV